jgi:hypothetical protein
MMGLLMNTRGTVVNYSNAGEDELGRPARTETGRTEDVPLRLDQIGSVEGEAFTTDRWRAEAPIDLVIDAGDEILEGGRRFIVEGSPNRMIHPFVPSLARVEVLLTYVGTVDR